MKITQLDISAVHLIQLNPIGDERGFFARMSCQKELSAAGLNGKWQQINTSMTMDKGVVRGFHFQRQPDAEVKMVRCVKGAIFDVAVDLRENSKTFGKWVGRTLSAENREMLYIPEGFAHGFQSLEIETEIIYFNSANYNPNNEGGVRYDDPEIDVVWPLPISLTSERDQSLPNLESINPIKIL